MAATLTALAPALFLLLQDAPGAALNSPDELWSAVNAAIEPLYPEASEPATATMTTDQVRALVDRVARDARPLAARHRELLGSDELAALLEFELASFALERADAELAERLLAPALEQWPDDLALLALAAEAAMQRGEWNEAGERLAHGEKRSAASATPSGDPLGSGLLRIERTLYELRLGRSDRAWLALEELLATPDLDAAIEGAALAELADLQLLCDRPADALATAERALARDDPELTARAPQFALVRALAIEDLDEVEATLRGPGLSTAAFCLGTLRAAELALDAGERERAQSWLAEAGAILDGGDRGRFGLRRERSFREALLARWLRAPGASRDQLVEADARAAKALELLLEEWRTTPLLTGGISFLRSAARRAVLHEALSGVPPELAFARIVEVQALGSVSRREAIPVPSLREVREALLAAGELLLVVLPTRRGSHLFAADVQEIAHFELPGERELAAAAAADLKQWRELLLPDELLPRLERASLIRIVGADLLGEEAVEELPLPPTILGGGTLGALRPIAHLPSIPVGVALRRRAASRNDRARELDLALVIGPERTPDGRSRFEIDDDAIRSPFASSRVVRTPAASLARGEIALPAAHVAAFVAHGLVDRRRDRFCGLLLANDAGGEPLVAWADAFERAELPSIVALVACSAAEGPVRVGEDGATHLGGAALAGGATSVLLGRGELDAEANLRLLQGFLTELAAGAASAESLRRARAALARDPSRARRARLELQGLGDESLPVPSQARTAEPRATTSRSLLAGLAALAGVALVIVGFRWIGARTVDRRK